MDNNELNNNANLQPNVGSQILMGDVPNPNNNMQPQNNININQETNTNLVNEPIQNTQINQSQPVQAEPSLETDTIFSDVQPVNNVVEPQVQQPVETQESVNELSKQKKNKTPKVIIIILLLVLLSVGGYFAYDKFFANKSEPDVTPKKPKEVVKKILLKDENLDIVYSDLDEKHEGKIKRTPYLNINSKYAEEINNEIKTLVEKGLDGQAPDMAYTTDYQYYINDEIISLKFSWQMEGEQTTSKIYNINKFTGEKVSNAEILKQANIDEVTLNNKLVESYKIARPLESIEGNGDNLVKECYQKDLDTLSNGNIKAMYLGENNELWVLFDVNYIAGAGLREAILNVTTNKVLLDPVLMK